MTDRAQKQPSASLGDRISEADLAGLDHWARGWRRWLLPGIAEAIRCLIAEVRETAPRARGRDDALAQAKAARGLNEALIGVGPILTRDDITELTAYVEEYRARGVRGVWWNFALSIEALLRDRVRLRKALEDVLERTLREPRNFDNNDLSKAKNDRDHLRQDRYWIQTRVQAALHEARNG